MSVGRKTLKDYMTSAQKEKLKHLPTWRSICTEKIEVSRPGKTARDRAKTSRGSKDDLQDRNERRKRRVLEKQAKVAGDGSIISIPLSGKRKASKGNLKETKPRGSRKKTR